MLEEKLLGKKAFDIYDEKIKTVIEEGDVNTLASAQSYVDAKIEEVVGIDVSKLYSKEEIDTALSGKVDKVDGKVLSTNDYTNEDKLQVETNK